MLSDAPPIGTFCPECGETFAPHEHEHCPYDDTELRPYAEGFDHPRHPLRGEPIDERFEIESLIGREEMSLVCGGRDLSVERAVTIELLPLDFNRRERAVEAFFEEAEVFAQLSHPGLVNLLDVGQHDARGYLYLVTECHEGQTLAELLGSRRFHPELALELIRQIASGLAEPHAKGVFHCNIAPRHVMLLPDAEGILQFKLVDLGLTETLHRDTNVSSPDDPGVFRYMAPESLQNQAITRATDIYELGIVLFEMLTGWPPFEAEDATQFLVKHVHASPPSLRDILPDGELPQSVDRLVATMLAKDPNERFDGAWALCDRIEDIQREEGYETTLRIDLGASIGRRFASWSLPPVERSKVDNDAQLQSVTDDDIETLQPGDVIEEALDESEMFGGSSGSPSNDESSSRDEDRETSPPASTNEPQREVDPAPDDEARAPESLETTHAVPSGPETPEPASFDEPESFTSDDASSPELTDSHHIVPSNPEASDPASSDASAATTDDADEDASDSDLVETTPTIPSQEEASSPPGPSSDETPAGDPEDVPDVEETWEADNQVSATSQRDRAGHAQASPASGESRSYTSSSSDGSVGTSTRTDADSTSPLLWTLFIVLGLGGAAAVGWSLYEGGSSSGDDATPGATGDPRDDESGLGLDDPPGENLDPTPE